MRVQHGLALMPGQVAELDGEVAHGSPVRAGGCEEGTDVGRYEFGGEVAAGAEVEELEFLRGGIVEEVGPVGIRLHEFEFCDFAQTEAEDVGADPVLLVLSEVLGFGDADAGAEFCGQDLWARGFFDDGGNVEGIGFVGEKVPEALTHFCLADVVAFPG